MDNLEVRSIEEQVPESGRKGRPCYARERMFAVIDAIKVGSPVQINRGVRSLQYYVQRYRVVRGEGHQFVLRGNERLTKVWRVK